jgi:hypothetical protein
VNWDDYREELLENKMAWIVSAIVCALFLPLSMTLSQHPEKPKTSAAAPQNMGDIVHGTPLDSQKPDPE